MAGLREKIEKIKRGVIRKGRDYKKIADLNVEIGDFHQDINDVLVEIGEYVIENELLKEDANIQEWMTQIVFIREKIETKRERILEIKNVSICSRCGAEYPRTSTVCTKCGNEMGKS